MHKYFRSSLMILVLSPLSAWSQDDFFVSHVHGTVKVAGKKDSLKTGDPVRKTDSLVFKEKTNYITLISPDGVSKIARGNDGPAVAKRDGFWFALADIIIPSTKTGTTGIRAGIINSLFDMQNHLTLYDRDTRMLVIDSTLIPLGDWFRKDSETRFFFLRFVAGNDTINKRLRYAVTNHSIDLVLDKMIYTVDGKPVERDHIDQVQLFFYDSKAGSATLMGSFRLSFVTSAELMNELCVIRKHMPPASAGDLEKEQKVHTEMEAHVLLNHGKADADVLKGLIERTKAECEALDHRSGNK